MYCSFGVYNCIFFSCYCTLCIHTCNHRLEVYLQQNSIIDLFIDDYKALSDTDGITGNKSDTNLKEYQSFTDLKFSKDKVITWIDWHPTIKGTCLTL